MAELNIHIHITPSLFRYGVVVGLLGVLVTELSSESVTLTTYYPAPSGVYQEMITTGRTFLSRDSDGVVVGAANTPAASTKLAVMNGNVGIGTLNAAELLHVAGNVVADGKITVGGMPSAPPGSPGAIYYDTTARRFMGYGGNPGAWKPLGLPQVRIVEQAGIPVNSKTAVVYCPAGSVLIGCSGTRQAQVVDTCDENDCGFVGIIPVDSSGNRATVNPMGCKVGIDNGIGTRPHVQAYCMEL